MPAKIIIIGGGPAGLMAAEQLLSQGCGVTLYEAMPSVGRKFLLAGRGGLNLTHSEAMDSFVEKYGDQAPRFRKILASFDNQAMRDWAAGLEVETFIGSSGRVFPTDFKAARLLRNWLRRLKSMGLDLKVRHRFEGFDAQNHPLIQPEGGEPFAAKADAILLALGGASWTRMGADGRWVEAFQAKGLPVKPLVASNCGFEVAWSDAFLSKAEGQPLKNIALQMGEHRQAGEAMVTAYGIEGNAVYALSRYLRQALEQQGSPQTLLVDLKPEMSLENLAAKLAAPRGKDSQSTMLRKRLKLTKASLALLVEGTPREVMADPVKLAAAIKAVPVRLIRPRPVAEAISVAGGVDFQALTEDLMLKDLPGTFLAGEMLDWEAPTGGYLLQGCFAMGVWASRGILDYLSMR